MDMVMTISAELSRSTGRKTPRKTPPEKDEGPQCETCGETKDENAIQTEKTEHDNGAVTRDVSCADCGEHLVTDTLKVPDY